MTSSLRAVVLDTDVASTAFKRKPLPILVKVAAMEPVISFVTFGELMKWTERRHWAPHHRNGLDQ